MKTIFEIKKLYVVIILSVLIIISFTTFSLMRSRYQLELRDVIKENKSTANLLSSLIYEHQKAASSIMEAYAQRLLFIDAVDKKDYKKAIPHLQALSNYHNEIGAPFITDPSGTLWANYPLDRTGFGKNLAHRNWYKGVSKDWKPYVSSIYRMIVLDKSLAVAVSVPVFDRNGKVIGILSGAQRTALFAAFIKANIQETEKSITVLDQEGNIIFSNNVPYAEKIVKYPALQVLGGAIAGVTADMEIADAKEKGSLSYVSIAPVKTLRWSVIVGHEKGNILKPLYGQFCLYALTGLTIFLLFAVGLFIFRREYNYRKTKEQLAVEEKYRILFEEALDGICLAEADTGIIIDCNLAMTALLCRKRTELIGQPQSILHPPQDDQAAVSPTFKEHLHNKQGQILETHIVTGTGDIREVEIKANILYLQGKKVMQGIFRDITERKRAEDALKKSEEKYHHLFDNAMEGVYQSTLEGRLITTNMAFCRMMGYESPEEFINVVMDLGSQLYVNPADRARAIGIFKEKGWVKNFECQMRRKDGSIFWARFDGRLTETQEGTPCLEGFIIDITDSKEAEEQIMKLNAELEQRVIDRTIQLEVANKEMETFSYSVSHDLRAPLRSIDGFSQVLLEEYQDKLDETGKADLQRIRKATQRMGFLIDDMLKLSRVTQAQFNCESIALSSIVRAIAETYKKNSPDRDVDVTVQEGISVQGDPYLMQIAIENLMNNAWKFTGKEVHPQIEFGTTVRDGKVVCFLRDNGVGFDMRYVDKLFGAFQRLHKTDEFPGTGIGLATVQRIINRHGGRIWAEAEVGKGATFYFTLS